MAESSSEEQVKEAYRTINAADPEVEKQATRLRSLYDKVGEDKELGEKGINEILSNGPGAAARLEATANAVAALHGIKE